jgi:hypothetical protein
VRSLRLTRTRALTRELLYTASGGNRHGRRKFEFSQRRQWTL